MINFFFFFFKRSVSNTCDVKTWKLNKIWYFIKRVWYVETILVVFMTRKWHHFVIDELCFKLINDTHPFYLCTFFRSISHCQFIMGQQWTIVFGYIYCRILTDGKVITMLLAFIFDGKRTLEWNLLEGEKENNFSGSEF